MSKLFQRYILLLRHPTFIISWFTLILLFAYTIDKPLAIYFHQHIQGGWMQILQKVTLLGHSKWYLISLASLTMLALLGQYKRLAWISGYLFLSIVVSGILCDLVKIIVSRARPIEWFSHQLYGLQWFKTQASFWSFPSGHSTTISALMMAISLLWPRSWLVCLSIALAVASSRIMIGAHYLSDIMAGLYLGAITSLYLKDYLERKYGVAMATVNTV